MKKELFYSEIQLYGFYKDEEIVKLPDGNWD